VVVPGPCRRIGATVSPGRSRWYWPGASGRGSPCAARRMAAVWGTPGLSWSERTVGLGTSAAWCNVTSGRRRISLACSSWGRGSSAPDGYDMDGSLPKLSSPSRRLPDSFETASKPQSGRNPEFFLELRVQLELGPQPVHEGDRVAVDAGDKHLTGFVQLLHAGVAAATADLLPHPVPEPFDRVEVRTVAGQVD